MPGIKLAGQNAACGKVTVAIDCVCRAVLATSLLGLLEEILWVTIKHHPAHLNEWIVGMRHHLLFKLI
jgi:hypothetical protein